MGGPLERLVGRAAMADAGVEGARNDGGEREDRVMGSPVVVPEGGRKEFGLGREIDAPDGRLGRGRPSGDVGTKGRRHGVSVPNPEMRSKDCYAGQAVPNS